MDNDIDVAAFMEKYRGRIQHDPNRRGALFSRIMTDAVLYDYKIIERSDCDKNVDTTSRVSTPQIARDCLSLHGMRSDGTNAEVITRAMRMDNESSFTRAYSSDSFPGILDNVGSKAMTLGFDRAPETWPFICRQTTTRDFKPFTRVTAPEYSSPAKVPESGEITRPQLGNDSKETGSVGAYPFLVSLSRQAVISDDLDALTNVAESAGRAASRLNGDLIYGVLTDNNAMADSITLFHSSHANVGTGAAPSTTTLNEFRNLMASQTGPSGETLNVRLALLIGPPELEGSLVALRDQAALPDPLTPGYRAGAVSVVTDARLSGTAFFGCADPSIHSGIELVTLEGSERPLLERTTIFVSDSIDWKVLHDATALAVDYRTLVYNAGA